VQEKGHSLLAVGSVNMDLVMQLERAPQGGETLPGREYSYVPGGRGANQAVAAARLAREEDLPVILDAGPVRDLDFSLRHGLQIISPNESETRAITGIECRGAQPSLPTTREVREFIRARGLEILGV
jgi:ribokinase